ncbi:MAG: rhomboid family intramembrane serine protease [Mycobacteriaceae bacterium]|nr:rhomboid family intramembrane serine protease [Mycobacteriaceae bacterium]
MTAGATDLVQRSLRDLWRRAPATSVLIALNVLAYLVESVRPNLIVGRFGTVGEGYLETDGGYHLVGIAHGQWYRLITGTFLHSPLSSMGGLGILHLLLNMSWLWILGPRLEGRLGRGRYLALYFLSALSGSVLSYWLAPHVNAIGASGAVYGLIAGFFVLSRRMRLDSAYAKQVAIFAVIWLVASATETAWQAHLGGALAGAVLAYFYAPVPGAHRLGRIAATAGVLALLAAAVLLETHALTGSWWAAVT